jgi:single-stranded DNA-binding protein
MKKLQNKVHLMGKLSLVPETKLLENGRKVVHMTLSTLETYKNETTGLQTTELFYHQLIA